MSSSGRTRLAFEAQRAMLEAEGSAGLFTGEEGAMEVARFFSSDLEGHPDSEWGTEVKRSPGPTAEMELARAHPGRRVYHVALHTRRFSGHDGVLIDVDVSSATWIGGPSPVAVEGVRMTYCVRRARDGRLQIETVSTGMVYG